MKASLNCAFFNSAFSKSKTLLRVPRTTITTTTPMRRKKKLNSLHSSLSLQFGYFASLHFYTLLLLIILGFLKVAFNFITVFHFYFRSLLSKKVFIMYIFFILQILISSFLCPPNFSSFFPQLL